MTESPLNFRTATFLKSAQNIRQCPADEGAEVAFAGRSNAGKSSAINRLTEQRKLARTSKTPGRTQLLNFFVLANDAQKIVDLPGYGYAKVPPQVKEKWQRDLTEYLEKRQSLMGLVLLMDIRHPMQPFDQSFLDWAKKRQMPVHILLTKSDKLKRGAAKSQMLSVKKEIKAQQLEQFVTVQTFSSLKGDGLPELRAYLNDKLAVEAYSDIDPDYADLDIYIPPEADISDNFSD